MPDLSADRPTIRKDGYSIDLYFTPFVGEQVWTGIVASTPTFPANALSISGGSGTIANVKRGMRVVIETSGGLFKGETHIRAAGTISSTLIPIRETSKGTINIASGDRIRVYNAIYLQDKLVSADPSFSPDSLAYSAQNSTVPPIAISGGHFVAFVDSGQTYATIQFAGSTSYTVDPDSGSSVTHEWVFPSATGTTTKTTANPSFTFPVGYHIGSHTVTDATNSATWTQFVMGHVYDATTRPHRCVVNNIDASLDSGWSASVQLFEDASLSDIPDRCMGIVWSQETYFGTVQSFGNVVPSRSHIKAVGYVARDTNRFDPVNSTVTFDLISPLARLQQLPGYSKVMLNTASPDLWREIEDLTIRRAVIVLLRYYTNLTEIFDFFYDAEDYDFPRFYLQKNTPYAQVNELADGVDARFVVNRTGRFMVQQRQELMLLNTRSALTTTLTLLTPDISDYEFSRDHFRTVELLEARGFIADDTDPEPIFSRWPGLSPGQGTQASIVERMIASDQSDLSARAGMRGAALDGVFIDSNQEYRKGFDIRLTLRGAYDVFDYYREWIELNIDGTTNLRGIDLSDFRFYLVSASISYDHSVSSAITELTLRTETAAPAGVKYTPTAPINSNTPDYTPPDLDIGFTPVPNATVLLPGYDPDDPDNPDRAFALNQSGAQAAIGEIDIAGTTINWTEISTGLTGNGVWASGDPYNYGRMFVLTTTGLYKCEDIWSFDSWSLVADNNTMFGSSTYIGHKIKMNITKRGYIIAACGDNFAISFDYGLTWTQVDPSGGGAYSTTGFGSQVGDMETSPYGGGYVWFSVYNGAGNTRIYFSSDWGLTSALQRSLTVTPTSTIRLVMPYTRGGGVPNTNGAAQEGWIYYGSGNQGGFSKYTGGYATGGTTVYVVNAAGVESPNGTTQSGLTHFTWDANYFYGAGRGTGAGANRWSIFRSVNGTTITEPINGLAGNQDAVGVNGWPLDPDIMIMWSRNSSLLALTIDGAVNRFGTRPAFFTGTGTAYAELNLANFVAPA